MGENKFEEKRQNWPTLPYHRIERGRRRTRPVPAADIASSIRNVYIHAYARYTRTHPCTREIGGFGIRSEAPVGFMPYSLRSDTATRRVTPQTRGWRRKRRGPFPHPRGDRSRCLHLPLPATCLPCNEPMFAGHLLPYATVTARRYINDRRTADADKPRSGPLCHGERERASCGNGCFRIFGSNHAGLGSEEGSFFRGILLRFLSFFSF